MGARPPSLYLHRLFFTAVPPPPPSPAPTPCRPFATLPPRPSLPPTRPTSSAPVSRSCLASFALHVVLCDDDDKRPNRPCFARGWLRDSPAPAPLDLQRPTRLPASQAGLYRPLG